MVCVAGQSTDNPAIITADFQFILLFISPCPPMSSLRPDFSVTHVFPTECLQEIILQSPILLGQERGSCWFSVPQRIRVVDYSIYKPSTYLMLYTPYLIPTLPNLVTPSPEPSSDSSRWNILLIFQYPPLCYSFSINICWSLSSTLITPLLVFTERSYMPVFILSSLVRNQQLEIS